MESRRNTKIILAYILAFFVFVTLPTTMGSYEFVTSSKQVHADEDFSYYRCRDLAKFDYDSKVKSLELNLAKNHALNIALASVTTLTLGPIAGAAALLALTVAAAEDQENYSAQLDREYLQAEEKCATEREKARSIAAQLHAESVEDIYYDSNVSSGAIYFQGSNATRGNVSVEYIGNNR